MSYKTIVLKFGHSILKNESNIPEVIAETYLYLRQQYKIVVIVSALGNTTNELKDHIKNIFPDGISDAPKESLAPLLASGEIISSNLVTIGFNQAGIRATNLNHQVIATTGDILDSSPVTLNIDKINQLFAEFDVLVLPGFIGVNENNQTTLLGRGGSDFSAIFVANKLKAQSCVLYKDSHGIVENISLAPEKQMVFLETSYDYCLNIPYEVIQYKALDYAKKHQQEIIIKNLYKPNQTIINNKKSDLTSQLVEPIRKTKILLLGLGTVGLGVFYKLLSNSRYFEIVGIGVKNLDKHAVHGIDKNIISDDANTILKREYDVLVELVGGTQSKEFIVQALKHGKHVITANKLVIAENFEELHALAKEKGAQLKYSAAVAGVIPVLETIISLRKNNIEILEVSGILNGTSNFILTQVNDGNSLESSIKLAQEKGYAESDPTLDINGMDAFHKIKIISLLAFDKIPTNSIVEGLDQLASLPNNNDKITKLIATGKIVDGKLVTNVELKQLENTDCLAKIDGVNNCVVIKTSNAPDIKLYGKGAGRWPTAVAVYADILDLGIGSNYA